MGTRLYKAIMLFGGAIGGGELAISLAATAGASACNDNTPAGGGVVTHDAGAADEGLLPFDGGTAAFDAGVVAFDGGTAPFDAGVVPFDGSNGKDK